MIQILALILATAFAGLIVYYAYRTDQISSEDI